MEEVLVSKEKENYNLLINEEINENKFNKIVNISKDIYLRANYLSKLFFYWAYKIIRLGNYNSLKTEDFGILEGNNLSKNYYNYLEEIWEKKKYKNIARNALLKAIVRVNCGKIFLGIILNLFSALLEFSNVYLFRILIKMYGTNFKPPFEFLSEYFTKTNVGIVYISFSLIQAILAKHTSFYNNLVGSRATAQLNCMIYKKVLNLASASFKDKSKEGEIINFVQIDSEKLEKVFSDSPWIFINPIQITVYSYMLFEFMGISFVFGFAILFLIILINICLMRKTLTLTKLLLKDKDERMKITSETLCSLKVLKLYGWDDEFLMKINQARDIELKKLRKYFNIFVVVNSLFFFAPTAISVCSIGAYQYFNEVLHIEDIFTSLNIFSLIAMPLVGFPTICFSLLDLFVSMSRVEKFLKEDDVNESDIIRDDFETSNQEISIKIINGYYSWGKSEQIKTYSEIFEEKLKNNFPSKDKISSTFNNQNLSYPGARSYLQNNQINYSSSFTSNGEGVNPEQLVLKNLNLEIFKGEFVCVIGDIGSGKSSLIHLIMNNMIRIQEINLTTQKLIVNGTISYVPQTAWIRNDTIKNNILFFSDYDEQKYNHILDICELKQDLLNLPGGDMTEIGERGANLSGGQKSRISIARAVYANNDIFLFDDPISALDSQVGEKIIKNVILGQLKKKTIVLVTHALQFLNYADKIIYMENGEIKFVGTYDQINQQEFFLNLNNAIEIRKTLIDKSQEQERYSMILKYGSGSMDNNNSLGQNSYLDRNSLLKRRDTILEQLEELLEEDDRLESPLIKQNIIRITKDEIIEKGAVSSAIYCSYFRYMGGCCLIFIFVSFTFISNGLKSFSDIWLSYWTKNQKTENNINFFYIYAGLGFTIGIFILLRNFVITRCSLKLSKTIHNEMIEKLVHAPINLYHDTVPIGQILNVLSNNLNTLDTVTITRFNNLTNHLLNFFFCIAMCSFIEIYSLAFLPLLLIFGYLIFNFYSNSNRDISSHNSITRTPIIKSLVETMSGISTVRAFNSSKLFMANIHEKVDINFKVKIFLFGSSIWYSLTLNFFSILFLIFNIVFGIVFEELYTPQKIGIVLTYSLSLQNSLNNLLCTLTTFENSLVSMERCLELTKIPCESTRKLKNDEKLIESNWPQFGKIEYANYSVRYRPDTDLVLKNLNFKIQPREKIGVVGRTGSGKSTICLSLFRILEASQGKILIDDVDISQVGLDKLRSSLTIIPQDPNLMRGSLKYNIDPLNIYKEHEIQTVMKMIGWVDSANNEEKDLSVQITENGNNMSIGEKQLICITRAILRVIIYILFIFQKSKIVVMDEATANMDNKTEQLIQKAINKLLVNSSVITIAHRIKTIINYDKILVLDKGQIIEYDSPNILKNRRNSIFYDLYKKSNI